MSGNATRRGGFFVDETEVLPARPTAAPLPTRPVEVEAALPAQAPVPVAPIEGVPADRRAAWLRDDEIDAAVAHPAAAEATPQAPGTPWWRSPGRVLLVALAALVAAVSVFDAWRLLGAAFAESAVLGTLFASLLALLAGAAGWTAYGVHQDLARLRSVEGLREQARRILETDDGLDLPMEDYLSALQAHYASDARVAPCLEAFRDDVDGSLPARWQLERLSVDVFGPLDRVAFDTVTRHSQQAALLAMLSRIHLADFLIALWRSLALVRQIARTYGARPGTAGTARLWRGVLRNVVYAEVSEVAADTLGQVLGGGVAAKFSAQAAQGLGMGLLIGRLGLEAIRVCRPLPFTGREPTRPSLRMLGEGMLRLVRGGPSKGGAER